MHIIAVLFDNVVHGRCVPCLSFCWLLLAEVNTEFVLVGCRATLFVGGPSVSFVAAPDDAIVAGDVEFLRVLGGGWEFLDFTFVSHFSFPPHNSALPPFSIP